LSAAFFLFHETPTKGGAMPSLRTFSDWFDRGVEIGATHMIIVCDTFEWEDYPAYVMANENVFEVKKEYDGKNMQKIMEVYKLDLSKEMQLSEYRAFHY
jgi:hypothetical protein